MNNLQIFAICITVIIACVTMAAQAANAYVKAADLDGLRQRVSKLESQSGEFLVLKSEIVHIAELLVEIKNTLANKQDKVYHGT